MRLLLVVACVALSACGPDAPVAPPTTPASARLAPAPAEPPFYVLSTPSSTRLTGISLDDPAACGRAMDALRESYAVRREMSDAVEEAADWEEAEAAVARLAPCVPDLFADDYARHAAVGIIDEHLLRGPFRQAEADALIRHTETLDRRQSPEASVLAWALIRLDGWGSDANRARVARNAAERLGATFTRVAGCVGCTVDQALAEMPPLLRESNEKRLRDMKAVDDVLREIARQGAPRVS